MRCFCFAFFSSLLALFFSCSKDQGKPVAVLNCGDTTNLTFTNYVDTIMAMNCTLSGCHNNNDNCQNCDFTVYSNLKIKVDGGKFTERVLVQKNMPPSYSTGPTSLDPCTLNKLQVWINAGAPQ
jgi:hypothetical protein